MKKTKYYSLISILLIFFVAMTCGFLFACSGDGDADDDTDPSASAITIVGTWSNEQIEASAVIAVQIDATAAIELTVMEDGTYALTVSGISALGFNLSDVVVDMEGTWVEGEDDLTYTMTGEEGNEVTIVLSEDGEYVSISFSITYTLGESFSFPITVTDQRLYAGALPSVEESSAGE